MTSILQTHPWLKPAWFLLESYIKQKRVPQALLLIGNDGVGKQYLAEYFSKSLMCSSPLSNFEPCGKCQGCTLFKAKTHPDYTFIEPEEFGKAIGINIIRNLTTKLTLKPQFEGYRLVIINSADCLNTASANAFLKFLEEPTERTCLILITSNPLKLPATIRSRCQKLYVSNSDETIVKTWLEQQSVNDSIDLLLRMSQGAPLLAKQFSDGSVIELRAKFFKQWFNVVRSEDSFISIAEEWSKLDKNLMPLLLVWLIGWVTDLIKLKSGAKNDDVMNIDLLSSLQQLNEKLNLKALYKYYDFLLLSQQRLDTQLNKQLLFEEVLIQCSGFIRHK